MNVVDNLLARNRTFATTRFDAALKMMPKLRTFVIGCVDPRVDPAAVLGLEHGEAAILRNIGGRVTPEVLLELDLLRGLTQSFGGDMAAGFNLLVLHHTDCGIRRMAGAPKLADFFGATPPDVHDPRVSLTHDIAALRAHAGIADTVHVTGLVYDVATGRIEAAVPTAPLRG